jgi:hypothetical protein
MQATQALAAGAAQDTGGQGMMMTQPKGGVQGVQSYCSSIRLKSAGEKGKAVRVKV